MAMEMLDELDQLETIQTQRSVSDMASSKYYNNALIIYNDARVEDALNYLKVEMKLWKDNAIMDENEVLLDNDFEKIRTYNWNENCSTNPKLDKLRKMILTAYQDEDGDNIMGIVFVKTRDLAYAIVSWMKETSGLRQLNPIPFVGQKQSSDKGERVQAYIRESPKQFLGDIYLLQVVANRERQLKSLSGRRKLVKAGTFELKCIMCSHFICMSSDVKIIQGVHHVVVDESLGERVSFVKEGLPSFADETIQFSDKFICRECGDSLGVICIYKGMAFPVLRIQKVLIVDMNERQITCKQWKQVPFHVSQLDTDYFQESL